MIANTQTLTATPAASAPARTRAITVPWYSLAVVFCAACVPIGALWDISWHLTIGRDTFWTPAHLLIYIGGAVPGCVCGWLVLQQTFWAAPGETVSSVRLWGFRGPLGAWVVIWGSFAMIVSAPFDNWWHDAYGLDVQIISPPHTLLALGTYAVAIGGLLLGLSWQNNAPTEKRLGISLLVLFSCGTLLTQLSVFTTEYTYPNHHHAAFFYQVACVAFPLWLIVAARAASLRWAATGTAAMYTVVMLALIWILPRFSAHPGLAPIYNPVDHMVPPAFPLLLIVPAICIDLLMQRLGQKRGFWRDTGLALVLGVCFFALMLAVQWPFSQFLLSPAARNPVFVGNAMWGYNVHPAEWRTQFWDMEKNPLTATAGVIAIVLAAMQSRLALWLGKWFATVKR